MSPRRIAAILYLLVHVACANVNGGAVELSWKLRAASGAPDNFVNCDTDGTLVDSNSHHIDNTGHLVDIRLHWEVDEVPAYADFKCATNHGVTTFELPPGQAYLWVSPLCDNENYTFDAQTKPSTYSAPAPEQRTVIAGNTIDLGAVELVLEVSSCTTQPCICQ
jgi:hypothetical protein